MQKFSDTLRRRALSDDALLNQSYLAAADAVLGGRLAESLQSNSVRTRTVIDEVFRYYKTVVPVPNDLSDDPDEALEQLCRPTGIMHRPVLLTGTWYRSAFGAMIGQLKDSGQIIALIPGAFGGYSYYDFSLGRRVRVNRRTAAGIEEEAVFFYKPLPARAVGIRDLFFYAADVLTPGDRYIPLVLTLGITLIGSLTPILNQFLLDEVIAEHSVSLLLSTVFFLASLTLGSLLVGSIHTVWNSRTATKIGVRIEAATMMRLLSLPARFFRNWSAGELAQRAGYISELCDTVFSDVLPGVFTVACSFVYLGSIEKFTPSLTLPAVLILAGSTAVSVLHALMQTRISKQRMEASGKESGVSYALINGIRKIRLSGAEKRAMARWMGVYAKEAAFTYNPPKFLMLNEAIAGAITLAGTFVIYFTALNSSITAADYYAFTTAFGLLTAVFSSVTSLALSIANLRPLYDLARPILDAEPEFSGDKQSITKLDGRIELSKVSFTYSEKMANIINNLSFTIEPGEFVAVVGKTGCGKSTLIRLLLGFETPHTGAVYYDGKDIKKVDLKSLRRRIGVVLQDGKLFSGDIFSNIAISAPRLTLEEAWAAAEAAGIADDIRRMPMGMNTILSEGGGGISGGQRQRLLIARAIAPKPRVLILDEATSALDNLTQAKVSAALDALKCTRIVIAHRLSTIRHADRILYLEDGTIAESGTYEELMAKPDGKFRELVSRQQLDIEG